MLSYTEAKNRILKHLNANGAGQKLKVYEPGTEITYGWVFFYDLEGVFHPGREAIFSKTEALLSAGKSEQECLNKLAPKEKEILENAIGLVGNLPLFIDRESGNISSQFPPIEAIDQEIIEERTNSVFEWDLVIEKSVLRESPKLVKIHPFIPLNRLELIQNIKAKKPVFTTNSFREFFQLTELLKDCEISFYIRKRKVSSQLGKLE